MDQGFAFRWVCPDSGPAASADALARWALGAVEIGGAELRCAPRDLAALRGTVLAPQVRVAEGGLVQPGTLWVKRVNEQPLLFDELLPEGEPQPPERLAVMHNWYGVTPGHTCGECAHLRRYRQSTTWMKCKLTRQTSGAGTDWRAKWAACGRYEAAE